MRFDLKILTLLPLGGVALAAPAAPVAELDVGSWKGIQSTFFDSVRGILPGWSIEKASEIVYEAHPAQIGDKEKTVWENLKSDDKFSKLVKGIKFAEVEDQFDKLDYKFTFFVSRMRKQKASCAYAGSRQCCFERPPR